MKENKRKNNLKAKINNRTEVNKKEERTFDDQIEGRNSVLELLESGKDINKIFIEKGAMNTEEKEIALEEINDISVTTSSAEKFFKVGTVVVKYGENKECKLESIKQPMMVSELIHQYVEKARGIKSYSI